MNINWHEFITDIGLFGIATTAITYLTKRFIDHNFKTNLKDYEANLNSKQKEFEHKLLLVSNTQFKLYEKRIDLFATLYSLLIDADTAMSELTSSIKMRTGDLEKDREIDKNEMQNSMEALNAFLKHYYKNKIFFTNSINTKIEEINKIYKKAFYDYTFSTRYPMDRSMDNHDKKVNASLKIENEIPPIKKEIEEEIRKLFDTIITVNNT